MKNISPLVGSNPTNLCALARFTAVIVAAYVPRSTCGTATVVLAVPGLSDPLSSSPLIIACAIAVRASSIEPPDNERVSLNTMLATSVGESCAASPRLMVLSD